MGSWWTDMKNEDGTTPEEVVLNHGGVMNDEQLTNLVNSMFSTNASLPAVRQKRQALGLMKPRSGIKFAESPRPVLNKHIVLETSDVLVLSDIHAEYQDAEWLARVVGAAAKLGIKKCVVAGDLIDFASLSTWTPPVASSHSTLTGEIENAKGILKILNEVFEDVVVLLGNHEIRYARRIGQTSIQLFGSILGIDTLESVRISEYHWCLLRDRNDAWWRITHPKNASTIPVKVACELADKFQMNIVCAHGHDWGTAVSKSGLLAIATGMCADGERIEYVKHEDSTRPFMVQGAWMLLDGKSTLLHPDCAKPEWYVPE